MGDFALLDESLRNKKNTSPMLKAQSFTATEDPLVLEEIVRTKSVLIDNEEMEFHRDHTYAEVLNYKNMESERGSPFKL